MQQLTGAALAVQCLKKQGVKQILGIPGAKIDRVYDQLLDDGPQLIVCRHEQNAAFIAGAIGRMTGRPGVVLVTSGPGTSNLATGLVTATTEGDPVVAIAGSVRRNDLAKRTHQSMQAAELLKPATKYSVEVESADSVPEILNNAFRIAASPRKGASFVALPMDVQAEPSSALPLAISAPLSGPAPDDNIECAAKALNDAKFPVIFLGLCASEPQATAAIRSLLAKSAFPVVGTYQAAGVISRSLLNCFCGRVGLFRNQPGDILLNKADVILTIGFDPVEYDPNIWNPAGKARIIHLSEVLADIDNNYHPDVELMGSIADTIRRLTGLLQPRNIEASKEALPVIRDFAGNFNQPRKRVGSLVHPIDFVFALRNLIGDDVTVTVDMGSIYIYMVRYFLSFEPRRLLVSNGQQTLGVGLAWAIGACLVNPHEKVVSISGDGGFLFSAMELETAVRLKCNLVHFVWVDHQYNMVAFQQEIKYGRSSGVDFGSIDTVKHAQSYGAVGLRVNGPSDMAEVMKIALETPGPVIVEVPIDYSESIQLGKSLNHEIFH
jgi:acetolactate synthase-1/2/3 large subunit